MSTMIPLLTLEKSWSQVQDWVCDSLEAAGFWVLKTFDFRVTCGAEALCLYHGSQPCECQMVIFLVRGGAGNQISLLLRSCGGQTSISLGVLSENTGETTLLATVQHVLFSTQLQIPS